MIRQTQWFDLGRNLRACIGPHPSRPRRGRPVTVRFMVLGPMPSNGTFRPTMCAGAWTDGRAVIDSGMLGPELLLELEAKLRERAP